MGALTVQQVCIAAMQELSVAAAGEPVDPDDLAQVQLRFNNMVDAWAAERLMIYQTLRKTFPTVANQQVYALGPGGQWAIPNWAPKIVRAEFIFTNVNPGQPLSIPIHIYTDEEWADQTLKQLTSSIDWALWYETSFTNQGGSNPGGTANVNLFPVPTVNATIALWIPTPISEVADDETGLAVTLFMPPGYRDAMRCYLAVDSADIFKITVTPQLQAKMMRAMKRVRKMNTKPATLRVPRGLMLRPGRKRGYNILTNQP